MSVRINSLVFQSFCLFFTSFFVLLLWLPLVLQLSPYYVILLSVVGGFLGGAFGYSNEKKILKSIEEKGEYRYRFGASASSCRSAVLWIGILILVFAIAISLIPLVPTDALRVVLLILLPLTPMSFAIESWMVWQWQRKNQKKIIDSKKRIYAVSPSEWPPKPEEITPNAQPLKS
jgi:hypothetical protein